ncbi:MAG: ribosome maturation factor RimM [Bacteroidales bacterium]|jgi:16S rRNA processing protein RimM|nr:ribosome maturation factor RimM [Bacteroidales bacterium]
MDKKDCYFLGRIVKNFGLKGEVAASLDTDSPYNYAKLDSVLIEIGNRLVEWRIDAIRIQNNKAFIKFENTTLEDSERLIGKELYLPLTCLPPLEGNKFYYHEIIGFNVEDKALGHLGTITEVVDTAPQALLSIDHEGKEILLPLVDEFLISIDREHKQIKVSCPEGLVELYLN